MGIIVKTGKVAAWTWRRVADLGTLSWLWPGAAMLGAFVLAGMQNLPLALWLVFGIAAFCFALIGVILWQERTPEGAGQARLPASPKWTADNYDDEWNYHAHEKPVERDTPLCEALAFIAYRAWGHDYSQTVVDMFEKNAPNVLNDFHQLAYDGKITVWGKVSASGVYRSIPSEHWADHRVHAQALLNSYAMTSGKDTLYYGYLMVSRAEFEREWPQ